MKVSMIAIAVVLISGSMLFPATLVVPYKYATIQSAMDAAVDGDTVLVAPGTYEENIHFKGKGITVKSWGGPEVTVIDAGHPSNPNYGSGVRFDSGEGSDSVIEGFTITNGTGTDLYGNTFGGGIFCNSSSSPTIINNILHGNSAKYGGGIKARWYSHATISNNLIYDNTGSITGGGMGFSSYACPTITNNTITKNYATEGGGMSCTADSNAVVTDCIFWDNDGKYTNEIFVASASPVITYCDVKGGWSGTGNINADPLFYDPAAKDYHLSQHPCQTGVTNPCVDTGSDSASNLGMDTLWTRTDQIPDAGTVDMGYHYGAYQPHGDSLFADASTVSAAYGEAVNLTLDAGQVNMDRQYLIMGGVTGSSPGTLLPGGQATLPVNWDAFTNMALALTNTAIFDKFLGNLDAQGCSTAIFDSLAPLPPEAVGLTICFAYALTKPWDYASNHVEILVVQ